MLHTRILHERCKSDYTPCTGKNHESVAVLPRVLQAREAIQQQTSDIASTWCVICLSNSYHSNIHGPALTLAIGHVLDNQNSTMSLWYHSGQRVRLCMSSDY